MHALCAGPDMAEQLRKLRLQVQQRDNEINILVGMLKRRDAAGGAGGAAPGAAGGMMMGGGLPALAAAPTRPTLGAPHAAGVPMAGGGSNGVWGGAAAGGSGQQAGVNGGGVSMGSSLAGSPKAGPYGQTQAGMCGHVCTQAGVFVCLHKQVGKGWSAPLDVSKKIRRLAQQQQCPLYEGQGSKVNVSSAMSHRSLCRGNECISCMAEGKRLETSVAYRLLVFSSIIRKAEEHDSACVLLAGCTCSARQGRNRTGCLVIEDNKALLKQKYDAAKVGTYVACIVQNAQVLESIQVRGCVFELASRHLQPTKESSADALLACPCLPPHACLIMLL
eukprot:1146490-Pelagomonas_calceolata.AAC.14